MSVRGPLGATPQTGAFDLRSGALDPTRPSLRRGGASARVLWGRIGLAGVLVCGLLVSIAAANTDSLLPESVRPVPHWLAGPFGSAKLNLHVGGVFAVMVLMFASYALAVRAAESLSARTVLMGIAALHALMLLAPPLLSTDVSSYPAYSRMWAPFGANPYLHGPHAIALDPVYPFIGAKWVAMPSAYGPVWVTLSYALAPLSIAASALTYKAIAALASLATVALVWNAARLRGVDPVKAAALVGLNPLVVVYGAGGGHNDLLMVSALMAGLSLLLLRRVWRGELDWIDGAAWTAAALLITASSLLPWYVAWLMPLAALGSDRRLWRTAVVITGVVQGIQLLGYIPHGSSLLGL